MAFNGLKFTVTNGVRHGAVLSPPPPPFFLMYISMSLVSAGTNQVAKYMYSCYSELHDLIFTAKSQ